MARKKITKNNSNSYWMKFGGTPRKMHKGGFTHPHPHPKNATEAELRGAELWSRYTSDGNPLDKNITYNWTGDDYLPTSQTDVAAFKNTRWFDFFPDTSKNVPRTLKELQKYETSIDAHKTRTIELYDTKFDDFGDLLYSSTGVVNGFAAMVPHPYAKAAGWAVGGALTGGKAMWDWYKRDWNEDMKEANPDATFVNPSGDILNYEDNEHSLFNSFLYDRGVKNVRVKPSEVEKEDQNLNINRDQIDNAADDPLLNPKRYGGRVKRNFGGGSNTDPTQDPTFKMWFAKNAQRPDVMQNSGNINALSQLFFQDTNLTEMPLFSNEMNDFGGVDKSKRPIEISEKIVGGMKKYGGMPKAELGMGQGLYKAPTDGHYTDYSNSGDRANNFNMKLGEAGDTNFMKMFNYVVPGLGTVLDIGLDYMGYKGEQEKHHDLSVDAMRSKDNLLLLNKKDANKETLDLSTRRGALNNKASYNEEGPDFWDDFGKEAVSDVASAVTGGFDTGMFSGGGGGDLGDAVDYNEILDSSGSGGMMARYGGRRKADQGGHMAAESGMDLRNLHRLAMGGANQFQPGLTAAMINGEVNPLSHDQQFKSAGIEQQYNAGGNPEQTEDYEAEGGEVIMHAPGEVPVTTAETEQIDGEPNEAMLSMLEGKNHESGGEIVEGGGDQYVFSKSLKSKTWESNFADAAEKIGKHITRFKKEAENGDGITQTTAMSMIDAWNQKLTDLQQEQEKARQTKFMEMVEGGAPPEKLNEAFPDLFQQFMQQQQGGELSASANGMEGQAQMAPNPMGDIDMSQLSAQDQQLVGAEYGLPSKEFGDPFEAYDFNRYFGDLQGEGMFDGVEQGNFELGNDYFGKKSGVMDFLEMNYPDGGYEFGEETFTNSKDMYNAMQTDFGTRRNTFLESQNTSTTKPVKDDYMKTIQQLNPATNEMEESWDWIDETSKASFTSDKARHKLYNSGLPGNWDENYGRDAEISRRKYFKTLETQLLADGKSPDEIKSIIKREKLKLEETTNLEQIAKDNAPLTDEEKAEALKKKLSREALGKKGMSALKGGIKDLATLAPTLYNMKKGKENVEVEPFIENENEALIKENLNRLANTDITLALKENEDNFNQLKYLARNASDGSSGSMMNTLLRGQNLQNDADAKLFAGKTKADQLGLKIGNESLFQMGEKNRTEEVRGSIANSKNRAAKEAFEAKGWEGLSGFSQLKEQMANQASRDEQLKGLLHSIYPDAHLYTDRDGTMDINKLIESGDLDKLMKANPELADIFKNYFNNEEE